MAISPLRRALAALPAACLALALAAPAAAQDGGSSGEPSAAEDEPAFTPPLFGAPERRIGAGSRELGGEAAKCAEDAERAEGEECPEKAKTE